MTSLKLLSMEVDKASSNVLLWVVVHEGRQAIIASKSLPRGMSPYLPRLRLVVKMFPINCSSVRCALELLQTNSKYVVQSIRYGSIQDHILWVRFFRFRCLEYIGSIFPL